MRGSMHAVTLLLTLLALGGSASATCPDFAAWLRPENQVSWEGLRAPRALCVRAPRRFS